MAPAMSSHISVKTHAAYMAFNGSGINDNEDAPVTYDDNARTTGTNDPARKVATVLQRRSLFTLRVAHWITESELVQQPYLGWHYATKSCVQVLREHAPQLMAILRPQPANPPPAEETPGAMQSTVSSESMVDSTTSTLVDDNSQHAADANTEPAISDPEVYVAKETESKEMEPTPDTEAKGMYQTPTQEQQQGPKVQRRRKHGIFGKLKHLFARVTRKSRT